MADIVYFKGEDFDEGEGDEVGSVMVVDAETGDVRSDHGWKSKSYARELATRLMLPIELDRELGG
ncbi:MAG TPA: hypothetical protein VFM43_02435 [Gaiellaceae bacterium]|nr:hypothetical protein [Gaiellaceae bacterium]